MFAFSRTQSPLRQAITDHYRCDEAEAVQNLLRRAAMSEAEKIQAQKLARRLVEEVRKNRQKASGVDALMLEFSLSSEEGVALMCLAEALLRIPDKDTRQKLIRDKLAGGDWGSHLNNSPSFFVNAAAWGLLITGKLSATTDENSLSMALTRVLSKGGQPLIHKGVDYAMRLLGKQFVTGQNIEEALKNGREREEKGYRFSFDMLGEAALTEADAQRYYQDYVQAIHAIGQSNQNRGVYEGNGISVKLSAIHPRYSRAQRERVLTELLPRLKALFILAKQYNLGLNIDAEEANRLELSLDLMEALLNDADLADFQGVGFVVQAYQKRAPYVIEYLIDLARKNRRKIMVRLVKGAYWDSEIKWTQTDGLDDYPVFTRKVHTDVSYLACARLLFSAQDVIFPQFATHNAYSLAAVYQMGEGKDYEFQCLHGMGEALYDQVVGAENLNRRCRIYAPVGTHETLLAYLVRRLLENGANSSFVNQIVDEKISLDDLVRCPLSLAEKTQGKRHAQLPRPRDLFAPKRCNSRGLDLSDEQALWNLQEAMNAAAAQKHDAQPLTALETPIQEARPVINPADHDDVVGEVRDSRPEDMAAVLAAAQPPRLDVRERAAVLRRFADLLEAERAALMMLALRESGKTLNNAIAEIREAVDFCHYYAAEAEAQPREPLGVLVAISPWNFPLAIFVGEVVAAWVAGNAVVAKPAEQSSLIAHRAVQLLHQAGAPRESLQLVLGAGDVGAALTANPQIAGVIFTGSTEVARAINRQLSQQEALSTPAKHTEREAPAIKTPVLIAEREAPAIKTPVLIAETGGMNAMIVDSTALPEQVCADVLNSAFDSAGQRCSALRILCLQEDIADGMLRMIKGAMDELVVGNPRFLATDVGPVIDGEALANLQTHIERFKKKALAYHEALLPADLKGSYVAPILFELSNLSDLQREVFGPVLHVVRFKAKDLNRLIQQINRKGYALTHGIHSRIDRTVAQIMERVEAGNVYVNRNIVGAVVGVQPFGGHGLSGTGPKAGGPFYLQKLSRGSWNLPELTEKAQADESALAEVGQLLENAALSHPEQVRLAGLMGEARVHQLRGAQAVLPSITGERNVLSWRFPEKVSLYGGTLFQALQALILVAAAGGRVEVSPSHPLASWSASHPRLISVHAVLGHHVLLLEALPSALRQELAARESAIAKVVDGRDMLDVLPLFDELSLSVNTTAAGGNASLMAVAEA